ncbi:hypothetical protein F3Y22_tig00111582pilonHSYRG00737 [Hibiscus syriacus]|uniref:DUF4283 domain-containing protein n=1 Tax=Hibiscus syriacus TaxID=106335 RepID=A0A6A2YIU1_HIBSY|nr:hypothetical protein F3Y22_tig00111582pilonHSYRG00737 [Hibiscus syriacus]
MARLKVDLEGLVLDENEENILIIENSVTAPSITFDNCFVSSFLTSSTINFMAMRSTLATVWHPIGEIAITELGDGRYLFRLYHHIDFNRIELDGPWYFNNHFLLMHRLEDGDDLREVPLTMVDFWVRVNELSVGFMSKGVARQLGNFIGKFFVYYTEAVALYCKGSLRVRVRIDIQFGLPEDHASQVRPYWGIVAIAKENIAPTGVVNSSMGDKFTKTVVGDAHGGSASGFGESWVNLNYKCVGGDLPWKGTVTPRMDAEM